MDAKTKLYAITAWVGLIFTVIMVGSPYASASFSPDANLVAYWKLDETSGTTAFDSTSNHNDGTLCGNNVLCTPAGGPTVNQAGVMGTAYSFDGTNDCVTIPNNALLDPTAITVAVWAKLTTDTDTSQRVLRKGSQYAIQTTTDTEHFSTTIVNGVTRTLTATSSLDTGVWYHVAVTFDRSVIRFYVNGLQEAEATDVGDLASTTNPFIIGSEVVSDCNLSAFSWFGLIDEVRIYNRALSAQEVFGLSTVPPTDCALIGPDVTTINTVGSAVLALGFLGGLIVFIVLFGFQKMKIMVIPIVLLGACIGGVTTSPLASAVGCSTGNEAADTVGQTLTGLMWVIGLGIFAVTAIIFALRIRRG